MSNYVNQAAYEIMVAHRSKEILAKIIKSPLTACWLWAGKPRPDGYGRYTYRIDSSLYLHGMAHRLVYCILKDMVPREMDLDHLCRNRLCVNPEHLEIVPAIVNVHRGVSFAAVNAAKTHCVRGHPLTGTNLGRTFARRRCLTCKREDSQRYRDARR